jgi:hypothetical protein
LNVKNVPNASNRRVKERGPRNRGSVAQEITHTLDEAMERAEPSSMDVEGLGADTSADADPPVRVHRQWTTWVD